MVSGQFLHVEELSHQWVEHLALGRVGNVDAVVVDQQSRLLEPRLPALIADVLLHFESPLTRQGR